MIWNETKECMSRDEMHKLQSARLVKLVDYVYHNVEYYRKKMQAIDDKLTPIHRRNLAYQIDSVAIPLGMRAERRLAREGVTAQGQHIVQPQKIHVDECILNIGPRMATADQVWDDLHAISLADRRGDADCARTSPHDVPFDRPVGSLSLLEHLTVVGDGDVGRIVGHQAVDVGRQLLHAGPFEGWQQLEGKASGVRSLGLANQLGNTHRLFGIIF